MSCLNSIGHLFGNVYVYFMTVNVMQTSLKQQIITKTGHWFLSRSDSKCQLIPLQPPRFPENNKNPFQLS